ESGECSTVIVSRRDATSSAPALGPGTDGTGTSCTTTSTPLHTAFSPENRLLDPHARRERAPEHIVSPEHGRFAIDERTALTSGADEPTPLLPPGDRMSQYWPLLGVAVVVVGFALKRNPVLIVVLGGVVTALAAGKSIGELLELLGTAVVRNRALLLFLL